MKKIPKHACVMPFHHMAMRPDGQIFPCCVFRQEEVPDDLNVAHPDPFNHEYMNWLRQKMLNDEYVHGCKKCYEDEKHSARSMRTDLISPWGGDFGLPSEEEGLGRVKKLTNIDLALSNVCNNKCRMCMPQLSTHWYSDAKKLGMEIPKGVITNNTIVDSYDLSDLRFIKVLGGEPMMEQAKLKKVLNKCTLENITILLVTNVSILPDDELLDLLKQCKNVNIDLSIDSYGTLNEFLRKDSNWQNVYNNIQWYKEHFDNINVHSAISAYNVNKLHEIINFCVEQKLYHECVVVDGPQWMQPRNLPNEIKSWLLDYLEDLENNTTVIYKKIINLLKNEMKTDGDFGLFVRNDAQFNKIRNEHWMDKNEELWNRIEKLITPELF
jgi:sulfatase maturation enzyme AslB (radical SAM superfamily)